MTRACIADLEHANGVHERHHAWPKMNEWMKAQPEPVQFLAAEFNFGLRMNFEDGSLWVAGYGWTAGMGAVILASPICPQCYGEDRAAGHPGAEFMDPAKLRARTKKQ